MNEKAHPVVLLLLSRLSFVFTNKTTIVQQSEYTPAVVPNEAAPPSPNPAPPTNNCLDGWITNLAQQHKTRELYTLLCSW